MSTRIPLASYNLREGSARTAYCNSHFIRYNVTHMQNDTITAIATPPGPGGIGVIRISGAEAFAMALPLLRHAAHHAAFSSVPPSHQLTYAHIIDSATGETLDEVLVAFMSAPHTY